MIGDSTSYVLAEKGRKILSGKHQKLFDRILGFYDTKEKYLPCIFFIYGMISPFPNDLITLSA